jgi:hypothetical protein
MMRSLVSVALVAVALSQPAGNDVLFSNINEWDVDADTTYTYVPTRTTSVQGLFTTGLENSAVSNISIWIKPNNPDTEIM